jgi:hypothetical protein
VTKFVQFAQYNNTFPKIPPSTSMHFATRVRTWRVACLYSEIALCRKPFGIGQMYIYSFLLRMTDIKASEKNDSSSWNILYIPSFSNLPANEIDMNIIKFERYSLLGGTHKFNLAIPTKGITFQCRIHD